MTGRRERLIHSFFVTCAPGIEPLLHEEIRALRLAKVERQVGGVVFRGRMEDAWRANLWLRTAVRVLMRVARFEARDADGLYAGTAAVDWERFLRPGGSIRVDAGSRESALDHTLFVKQKVKDAVVDTFRARYGARPAVDLEDPDLGIYAHLFRDRCTLSVDTSGPSLHKRGWRRFQGRAPLAETLAAAMVLQSGWDRRAPLLDPFCGSGTILIEAALIAGNVAPGLFRPRFGFERWPGHRERQWREAIEAARASSRFPAKLVIRGWDANAEAIRGARRNLEAAGLAERVAVDVARAEDFAPRAGWNAWVVTNPPYGERVGTARDLQAVYRRFGAILRERCAGYRVALLSGSRELWQDLALEPARRSCWKNGALDCRLLEYRL